MSKTSEEYAFELFLSKSRNLHEERHPGAKIDEKLFKKLAQDKWSQGSMNEKAKFLEEAEVLHPSNKPKESAFVKFSRSKRAEVLVQNPTGFSVILIDIES